MKETKGITTPTQQIHVCIFYMYSWHVSTYKIDTFVTMSKDIPKQKRGRPPKPRPETEIPTPKRPQGRPRKADSAQPAPTPRPVGRPQNYPVFGTHPPVVSKFVPVILESH